MFLWHKSEGFIVLKARRIIQPMVLTIGKDSRNHFRSVGTEHRLSTHFWRKDKMSQSVSRVLLHIIFSTKDRLPIIPNDLEKTLHAYIAGIIRNEKAEAYRVGGTENHIHIACTLPRTCTQCDFVKLIKTRSSMWMKQQACSEFSWQRGYGVFSLGMSQLAVLMDYIDHQKEHHKTRDFKDEFEDILDKYGLDKNSPYLWD
jgi:putative transposase